MFFFFLVEKNEKGTVKAGNLKYKEEPSKLLSGNKFQDRYFELREGNLLLYKDMKVQQTNFALSFLFWLKNKRSMNSSTFLI